MEQLNQLILNLKIQKDKVLSIADSAYGSKSCLSKLDSDIDHVHLVRARNNRVIWKKSNIDPSY